MAHKGPSPKSCHTCSGTGKLPEPIDAYTRIMTAADGCQTEEEIIAEHEVLWADVLCLAREWRRLAPLDREVIE